jgi:transcriptional regulator with XRE-family HTH domain
MSQTTDLIKRLRAIPLSQSEISRLSGIPQPRISRWEAGDTAQSADDALRLAELLRKQEKKKSNRSKAEA